VLIFDGVTYNGHYTYSFIGGLEKWVQDNINKGSGVDRIFIGHATSVSNKTQYGIYVSVNNPSSENNGTILMPMTAPNNDIAGLSVASNYQGTVIYNVNNQSELLKALSNPGQTTSHYDNDSDFIEQVSGSSDLVKTITDLAKNLISIGTAMVQLIMLLFIIGQFLIDPYNILLLIIQFEGLTAIMALSGRGDVLDSLQKFAKYNSSFYTFMVSMANGMIQVLAVMVQALSAAVTAGVGASQAAINLGLQFLSWIVTLIAIAPK
jgi:hypothetical protein